jgi:hypothetical protein
MAKRRRRIKPVGNPIQVEGADDMARALREAGVETRRQVRNANQRIGKKVEGWAKTEARAGTRMQAAASKALLGGSTNDYAFVRITRDKKVPFALAAFWGVKGRRGWYASEKYRSSGKDQFPAWVGTGWKWGGSGGPYAINDTLRKREDEVVDLYRDAIEEAFSNADLPLE